MTTVDVDITRGSRLRLALRANVGFSALTGLVLLVAATPIAELMGVGMPTLLLVLGIGLIAFAAWLAWRTVRPEIDPAEAWAIVGLDVAWVVASAAVLVFASHWFSPAGQWIVGIVALIVADLAIFEYLGIRKLRRA